MKKVILLILTLTLLLAVGCKKMVVVTKYDVTAEGSIFSGSNTPVSVKASFSPAWLTEGDPTEYDKNIAAFSAVFSQDVYFRDKDLEKGTQNRILINGDGSDYDRTSFLSAFGFTNVKFVESFNQKEYETDTNDSVTMVMGYMQTSGEKNDIFVVSLRGAFSSGEWSSAFDIGADNEAFSEITGEHPEWKNKAEMKGISVAGVRALEFLSEYIKEHDDAGADNAILITGHSRGGSIAQILGAHFENDKNFKSRTYTFNSTTISSDKSVSDYKTIFNIFDTNDFYTKFMPFSSETFYRYGKTVEKDIAADDALRKKIAELSGEDTYSVMKSEDYDEYKKLFGTVFTDRKCVYETNSLLFRFSDEAEAESKRSELLTLTGAENGLALSPFLSVTEISLNANFQYEFELKYTKEALLQSLARTLAYGKAAGDATKSIFTNEVDFCKIIDIVLSDGASITNGHRLLNGYAICL